jgi:hypothetical protein
MKTIFNLMFIFFISFLLFGCTHKLTREEAETKLEKCGLGVAETYGLISYNDDNTINGVDLGRTEKILDKLAAAGFIKITPMDQWKVDTGTIVARRAESGTWTIDPGPISADWSVEHVENTLIPEAVYKGGVSFTFLYVNRFDVVINNPKNSNLEIKDGKIKIITETYSNFKVTGIMEVSPTVDMVEYTAEVTATPEGEALGAKSSSFEGSMKFILYDDGWRPEL